MNTAFVVILPAFCLWLLVRGTRRLFWPGIFVKNAHTPPMNADLGQSVDPDNQVPNPGGSSGFHPGIRLGGVLRILFASFLWWRFGFSLAQADANAVFLEPANHKTVEEIVLRHARPFQRSGNVPGLSIAAIVEGKVAVVGLGRKSVTDASSPDGDTVFEIGSISKVFTGILLATEVQQGTLKLDQTIESALPGEYTIPAELKSITLKQLTTHSSGLPRMPGRLISPWRIMQMRSNFDVHPGYAESEFRSDLADSKLVFPSGSSSQYSNFGAALLGHILSVKNKMSYEQLMIDRIAKPLGMTDTFVAIPEDRQARTAAGFRQVKHIGSLELLYPAPSTTMHSHLAGAGGIRSTANDMLRFLKANMNPDDSSLGIAMKESHQELFKANDGMAIGMHWLRRIRPNEPVIIWHNGGTSGYRSFLAFSEDGRAGVVVLSNGIKAVESLGETILKDLLAFKE